MHCVLKHIHPMLGVDFHIPWVPGAPAPAPSPVPYATMQILMGVVPTVFSKPLFSHMTDGFCITMEKGTDIGSFIPHVGPPSLTLGVEMLVSASKSHFGASQYKAEGKVMGCALLFFVNPNLNCGTPAPTPTGVVTTITTHMVQMSLGDILAGLFEMAIDTLLQYVLGKATGAISTRISNAIMRRMRARIWNRTFYPFLRRLNANPRIVARFDYAARYGIAGREATRQVLLAWRRNGRIIEPIVGAFMGGPLGADLGTAGVPTPGGAVSEWAGGVGQSAGQGLGDALDPPAAVGDYNNGAGAPAVVN